MHGISNFDLANSLPLGEGGLRAPEGEKFRMAKSRKTDEVFIKSFAFYLIRLVPRHLPQRGRGTGHFIKYT